MSIWSLAAGLIVALICIPIAVERKPIEGNDDERT